jgi:hypothetical protein
VALPEIYNGSQLVGQGKARRLSPFFIPAALINLASGHISIKYGFKGPNHAVVTACATGVHALGDAARLIALGDADVMVAGGTEAAVCEIGIAGFCAARALSTAFNASPDQGSRPWDEGRDGFVMGEGAGVMVLEELEHAKARGAKIYGEVIGYGMSGDANHITAPADGHEGAYRAMKNALRDAKIAPSDIQYVNAHGTRRRWATIWSWKRSSGCSATAAKGVAMSSTKSAIGHLLGAAGRGGRDLLAAGDPGQRGSADAEPGEGIAGERDRPRGEGAAGAEDRRGSVQQLRLWRHQRQHHLPQGALIFRVPSSGAKAPGVGARGGPVICPRRRAGPVPGSGQPGAASPGDIFRR